MKNGRQSYVSGRSSEKQKIKLVTDRYIKVHRRSQTKKESVTKTRKLRHTKGKEKEIYIRARELVTQI